MANDEAASTPSCALSPEQTRALFDILTHHETYHEIASFKFPEAISSYGFPFKHPSSEGGEVPTSSSAPILQLLLTRTVLPLPGVSQFPPEFWNARVQNILARLGEAELSESYDKGAMGTRKVLATGSSAIVEMLGRGMLGGVDRREPGTEDAESRYDHAKADDLERAWDNVIQGLVYGDLGNQVFDHFIKSDDLEALSPMAEAAVRHIVFHLATLIHQIFVLSPEGQYLLKLIENVHSLIPYKMMKQTLRIGNAATMINGMMRILLAKLSVASVTNWFGLTQNADDGMNLLQRIISLVLSWDSNEFKKSAERVEKATKGGPGDEMLRLIREHVVEGARLDHETVRSASERNSQSIITSIFDASNPQLNSRLTESQHAQCLEYYSSLLSVRDRDRITSAFCRQSPDVFTQAIKDVVAAYEPMIRTVHANVDLREHFDSLQGFIEEFIKTSRPKKGSSSSSSSSSSSPFGRSSSSSSSSSGERLPSVEDYVDLLMRHRGLLYKWIHALASQCPDLWEGFRVWGNRTLVKFQKRPSSSSSSSSNGSTGAATTARDKTMPGILNQLYAGLGAETRAKVGAAIDSHAAYLSTLNRASKARLQCLVTASGSSGGRSTGGPGVYLSRWQALLDETPITPSQPRGRVRHGKDVKHMTTMGKTGVSGKKVEVGGAAQSSSAPDAPNVRVVVDALADSFRREVQELAAQISM
ncbi:hypothetical protein C2857_001310 [Epichloe festucae Fl1]|uniref:Uncharacterized protein n=1 Tax=Epichloe festucae (strain Fl1) TaxID=877507 RepID=A0A7S9KN72_EPIFF|nr:hypothetical protein C2857_001310 [Epichloe festucae Fl1]